MAGVEQIVVALGSPDGDASLIRYAALLARLGKAREVRFVHVADPTAPSAALRSRMRAHVGTHFQAAGTATDCDVLRGALTDRLLEYISEFQADLAIIGAKKHRLGARLAMVAPCSVAVVPNDFTGTLSHLLIALDFSDASARTLQWATGLIAAEPTIRATALHVLTHESSELFAEHETEPANAAAMRAILAETDCHGVAIESRLATVYRATDADMGRGLPLPGSTHALDVAHTVLAQASALGADCIALSTRGRSRSAAILLGSVTEKVTERATVPLLIGKHTGDHLDLTSILLGHAVGRPSIKAN